MYKVLKYARENKNGEFWQERFRKLGHTVETRILGTDIITTDDPENIKALLAAQFQDYGMASPYQTWMAVL